MLYGTQYHSVTAVHTITVIESLPPCTDKSDIGISPSSKQCFHPFAYGRKFKTAVALFELPDQCKRYFPVLADSGHKACTYK